MGKKYKKQSATEVVKEIKRQTRRKFTAEEKIKIVLEGMRGEDTIASICRKHGIHANNYFKWSKEFIEAGKRRLSGDTLLDGDDHTANFNYSKTFGFGGNKRLGETYGLQYAEGFHYMSGRPWVLGAGSDRGESPRVRDYINKYAVPL